MIKLITLRRNVSFSKAARLRPSFDLQLLSVANNEACYSLGILHQGVLKAHCESISESSERGYVFSSRFGFRNFKIQKIVYDLFMEIEPKHKASFYFFTYCFLEGGLENKYEEHHYEVF
jgi:hypothetical protein